MERYLFECIKDDLRAVEGLPSLSPWIINNATVNKIRHSLYIPKDCRKEIMNIAQVALRKMSRDENFSKLDLLKFKIFLEEFSEKNFAEENANVLGGIYKFPLGKSFASYGQANSDHVLLLSSHLFNSQHVAIRGGVARAALKAFILQNYELDQEQKRRLQQEYLAEKPFTDIDILLDRKHVNKFANSKIFFCINVQDIKTVNDMEVGIYNYLQTVDLAANSAVIWNGNLYFSKMAEESILNSFAYINYSVDPLFGTQALPCCGDRAYLLPKMFYRALSLLVRGRLSHLLISKENLSLESELISKYLILLLKNKIMTTKNKKSILQQVARVFVLAKEFEITQCATPTDFLRELYSKYASYFSYLPYTHHRQLAWLLRKFIQRSIEFHCGVEYVLPKTYTPYSICMDEIDEKNTKSIREYVKNNFIPWYDLFVNKNTKL